MNLPLLPTLAVACVLSFVGNVILVVYLAYVRSQRHAILDEWELLLRKMKFLDASKILDSRELLDRLYFLQASRRLAPGLDSEVYLRSMEVIANPRERLDDRLYFLRESRRLVPGLDSEVYLRSMEAITNPGDLGRAMRALNAGIEEKKILVSYEIPHQNVGRSSDAQRSGVGGYVEEWETFLDNSEARNLLEDVEKLKNVIRSQ